VLGSVNSNSNQITTLKSLKSQYASKTSLTPAEFFNFLASYAKPSKATGIRALGIMGTPTIRKESDLIAMARKTKTVNSGNVSLTLTQQTLISDAIMLERFGKPIPPVVAEKIAEKLEAFTDLEAQENVAWAIVVGIFGDPIPENVRVKIAKKVDVFIDTDYKTGVKMASQRQIKKPKKRK
jgi:hypothetical protein